MKSLKFKYAKATNTLCFGPEGIELHFSDFGNIIMLEGINLDNPGSEDNPASNGAGKSSVQEIISIGLYGKTIKDPKQLKGGEIVNELAGERGKATIEVEWDNYRVVRVIKAKGGNTLDIWESADHIWDDETLISKGAGIPETQKMIEEKLGMSHHSFCNVVVFDDSNSYSFLEADAPKKREIVENLLGLDKYREYGQNAKDLQKEKKKEVAEKAKDYDRSLTEIEDCSRRITRIGTQKEEWRKKKLIELKQLDMKLEDKQRDLENSDADGEIKAYNATRQKIGDLNESIGHKNESKTKAQSWLEAAKAKLRESEGDRRKIQETIQEYVLKAKETKSNLEKSVLLIGQLESLTEGADCPTCHAPINKSNHVHVLDREKDQIETNKTEAQKLTAIIEREKTKLGKLGLLIGKVEAGISEAEQKIRQFDAAINRENDELARLTALPRPDINAAQRVLESEITEIKRQIKSKKDELENDPYKEILDSAEQEKTAANLASKSAKKDLEVSEKELPYYEFWVKAFGDKGIRKFIVEGIIPALNSRIAYWLQYLIDGKMEVTFNSEFEESIIRNGTHTKYHKLSNGERRRVNLAVSQAFAHVMSLNIGCCPSIVFLDEITGGGIDRAGVSGIYNMIFELAKERQVFVTTHNQYLLEMLQGCETLTLQKKDDITVLL